MRRTYVLLALLTGLISVPAGAQKRTPVFSVGLELAKPLYFEGGHLDGSTGFGFSAGWEKPLGRHWSWTASAGYIHFSGDYHYFNFRNGARDTIQHNFALLSIATGFRLYVFRGLYLAAQGGVGVGLTHGTGTEFLIEPALGYQLRCGKHGLELSFHAVNLIEGFGIPEANSLQNGGYGYGSLRLLYLF